MNLYVVVQDEDVSTFELSVRAHMQKGYEPVGGLQILPHPYIFGRILRYVQALRLRRGLYPREEE